MIRLVVHTSTGQVQLDTYGDENIAITYNIDDITDIESKFGNYSKTFDLPATKNNNKFFKHLSDLQADVSQFDTLRGHKCELLSNDITIFEGLLYLNEIVKVKTETKYKVNLVGETIRFIEALGDATIRDLDFSELEHEFSVSNLTDSLFGSLLQTTSTPLFTNNILYSLIQNTGIVGDSNGNFTYQSNRNLQPFIKLYHLLEKIFDFSGFNIESNFISSTNTDFNHIYMDTGLGDQRTQSSTNIAYRRTSPADVDKISVPEVANLRTFVNDEDVIYNFPGTNGIIGTKNIPILDCFITGISGVPSTPFSFKNIHDITQTYTELPFAIEPSINPINGQINDPSGMMGTNGQVTIPADGTSLQVQIGLAIWAEPGTEITVIARLTPSGGGADVDTTIGTYTMHASNTGVFFNSNGNQEQDVLYMDQVFTTFVTGDSGDLVKFMIKKDSSNDAYLSQHKHVFKSKFIDTNNFDNPDFPPPLGMDADLSEYLSGGLVTSMPFPSPYAANRGKQFHRSNTVNSDPVSFCIDSFMPMTFKLSPQPANWIIVQNQNFVTDIITTRLHDNHGDVRLADIIKDMFKMFNLVCEQKGQLLRIEPFNSFMLTGTEKDWTKKIDTTEILQNYEGLPSKIIFSYNNDEEDYCLNTYLSQTKKEYGSMTIELPVDYINEKEIKLDVFSATAFKRLSTGLMYSCCYSFDEGVYEKFNNKPRLLFAPTPANGLIFAQGTDTNNFYNLSYYRAFTHYDDLPASLTASSHSLNFGYTQNIFISQNYNQPTDNLYNKYWFDYINQRFTADRVLVKAKIYLTESDIQNFSFADTIIIKNQKYKVTKIEYNAGKKGLAKLEMLKI